MRNRFENALGIQNGACNISGVGYSLIEACKEARAEGVDPKVDPAIRLIVHQLAFLARASTLQDVDAERAAQQTKVEYGPPGDRQAAVKLLGDEMPDKMIVMSERLVASALEARSARVQPAEDSAVRLILAWMADEADTKAIDNDWDTYGKLTQECREKNGLLTNRVFRIEAAGWDPKDPDDRRVLMVMAPNHKHVLDVIEGLGASCRDAEGVLGASFGGRIDFTLPEKGGDLQSRLALLANSLPVSKTRAELIADLAAADERNDDPAFYTARAAIDALDEVDQGRKLVVLDALGYDIATDSDHPNLWVWKTPSDGCDCSYATKNYAIEGAWQDAAFQAMAVMNLLQPEWDSLSLDEQLMHVQALAVYGEEHAPVPGASV